MLMFQDLSRIVAHSGSSQARSMAELSTSWFRVSHPGFPFKSSDLGAQMTGSGTSEQKWDTVTHRFARFTRFCDAVAKMYDSPTQTSSTKCSQVRLSLQMTLTFRDTSDTFSTHIDEIFNLLKKKCSDTCWNNL